GYEAGHAPGRLPLGSEGTAQRAAQTRALLHVRGPGAQGGSELGLPLLVRDQLLGVLLLASDNPEAFAESTVPLLSLFAAQTAVAVENARLHSTALRRRRQIELINLIARTAASASHTQQFFFTLTDLLGDAFEGARVAILLRGPQGIFVPAVSPNGEPDLERFRASARSGVVAAALEQRAAVLQEAGDRRDWPACFPGSGAELCAPLVFLGEAMGAVVLAHERADFFTADDRTLAQAAADVCATATRNVQLAEELHRVANLDFLTGCHNQRYFYFVLAQELARARRYNKQFGVILLDLRRFREVNRNYGFETGDQLLHKVARSLQPQLRSNDVLCRYMSDRFAVVLPEIDRRGVDAVMGKLRAAVEAITLPRSTQALALASASVMCLHDAVGEMELVNLLMERLEKAKGESQEAGIGSGAAE
ncbi:MAG TPA: diguanylate cyclase, partial [Terriglobales bacterium]|nr:diguanylate cyclase [Terriglobales bacterium]